MFSMWGTAFDVFLNSEWHTCILTGIRRVGCGAVEESGRASQVCHAGVVSVAVHGAGNRAVTGLLWRGAGGVTVRRHAAAAAHKTCRKRYQKKKSIVFFVTPIEISNLDTVLP